MELIENLTKQLKEKSESVKEKASDTQLASPKDEAPVQVETQVAIDEQINEIPPQEEKIEEVPAGAEGEENNAIGDVLADEEAKPATNAVDDVTAE